MKQTTTTVLQGPNGKPHFAIVAVDQPGWPLALMGPAEGPNREDNRRQAAFFADAPVMAELLSHLAAAVGKLPVDAVPEASREFLGHLVDRSQSLLMRHAGDRHGHIH